jgi:hypothetical protein
MAESPYDEDAPLALLWAALRENPMWQQVEIALLERRDKMVAQMVVDRPKTGEHPFVYALRKERAIGYIEAVNAIAATPATEEKKATAKAKETRTP